MTHDPEVEAGAIALAYVQKPAFMKADALEWWRAMADPRRNEYRYQACIVLEAVDALKGVTYAAAE